MNNTYYTFEAFKKLHLCEKITKIDEILTYLKPIWLKSRWLCTYVT